MARKKSTRVATSPILPIEEVSVLPEVGEANIDYRLMFEDGGYQDYVWNGTDYTAMPFDTNSLNELFSEMVNTITTLESNVTELTAKVEELDEEVFPIVSSSFDMLITSLIQTELELYDENDEIVPNMGLTTEYWEEPQELTYQNEVRKGTYYLKNADGYALGKSNGDIQPLVCDGSTVNLGSVEVIMMGGVK